MPFIVWLLRVEVEEQGQLIERARRRWRGAIETMRAPRGRVSRFLYNARRNIYVLGELISIEELTSGGFVEEMA